MDVPTANRESKGLRCLQDLSAAGVDAMIECRGCGRRVRIDTHKLMNKISNVQWWQWLDAQGQRLRCDECKHRGARIAPVPKIVGPLDCPEFQADIDALWERTMAEALANQCNAEIAPPDGDGLVYVMSKTDASEKMACLGTTEEAKHLMSDWLAAYDDDEPLI